MTLHPIDPNKEATYQITLGSTFNQNPRQSLHALKCSNPKLFPFQYTDILFIDNFKPAAIDYSIPGHLTSSEDVPGEVELALPSTTVPFRYSKIANNRMANITSSKVHYKKPKQTNSYSYSILKQTPLSLNISLLYHVYPPPEPLAQTPSQPQT
jgi:hypothetical protein